MSIITVDQMKRMAIMGKLPIATPYSCPDHHNFPKYWLIKTMAD
jgi:hypothetical protein